MHARQSCASFTGVVIFFLAPCHSGKQFRLPDCAGGGMIYENWLTDHLTITTFRNIMHACVKIYMYPFVPVASKVARSASAQLRSTSVEIP